MFTQGVSITRAIGICVGVVWILYKVNEIVINRKRIKMSKQNFTLILLLSFYLLISLASFLVAKNTSMSLTKFRSLVMLFIMTIIFYDQFRAKRNFEIAYKVLTYSGIIISVFLIIQYLTGKVFTNVNLYHYQVFEGNIRATGTYVDPNYAALNMIPLIPFSYYLFKKSQVKMVKLFVGLGFITSIVARLVSFSRSAYLSLMAVGTLIFLVEKKKTKNIAIIGLVWIIIAYFFPFEKILLRFNTMSGFIGNLNKPLYLAQNYPSLWQRYYILKDGWHMITRNFFTGVGLGNFMTEYPKYSYTFHKVRCAHNTYIGVMGELGIFGIIVFLAIIFLAWGNLKLAKIIFKEESLKDMVQGLKIGLFGFLFGTLFLTAQYERIFWVILAFSMIAYSVAMKEKIT
mgnify:CR=1 FL=1